MSEGNREYRSAKDHWDRIQTTTGWDDLPEGWKVEIEQLHADLAAVEKERDDWQRHRDREWKHAESSETSLATLRLQMEGLRGAAQKVVDVFNHGNPMSFIGDAAQSVVSLQNTLSTLPATGLRDTMMDIIVHPFPMETPAQTVDRIIAAAGEMK